MKNITSTTVFHHDIATIHKTLANHTIPHVFIKNIRENQDYSDSNIDILIHPSDVTKLHDILLQQKYWPTKSYKEREKTMYKHTTRTSLHIHHRISWHGIDYLDTDDLKELFDSARSIEVNGMNVPIESVEFSFLIHIPHSIYENYKITPGEITHLKYLQNHHPVNWQTIEAKAKKNGWSKAITIVQKYIDANITTPTYYTLTELVQAFMEKMGHELRTKPILKSSYFSIKVLLIFLITTTKKRILHK